MWNWQIYTFSLFSCSWDWNGVFFYVFCNLHFVFLGSIKWAFLFRPLCWIRKLVSLIISRERLFKCVCAPSQKRTQNPFQIAEKETFQGFSPKQKSSFDRNLLIYDFPSASLFIFKLDYFRNQLVRFIAMSVTHGQTHDVKIRSTTRHCREISRRWWHATDAV